VTLLVDTSVVVKWFHEQGEPEVDEARALLEAHRTGTEQLLVLDLGAYELGNVLLRPLRMPAPVVTEALAVLRALCGPLVHPRPSWHDAAAVLGKEHGLTFYDASWAAAAQALHCPLVSADRRLLRAHLAVTASDAVARLG
jgi:predicted nucleic acid-binding protein